MAACMVGRCMRGDCSPAQREPLRLHDPPHPMRVSSRHARAANRHGAHPPPLIHSTSPLTPSQEHSSTKSTLILGRTESIPPTHTTRPQDAPTPIRERPGQKRPASPWATGRGSVKPLRYQTGVRAIGSGRCGDTRLLRWGCLCVFARALARASSVGHTEAARRETEKQRDRTGGAAQDGTHCLSGPGGGDA